MLKGIPAILPPELLKILMEMGHGDELLLAVLPSDPYVPEIWDTYRAIGAKHEEQGLREEAIDKYTFYKRGAQTYAAVVTGERALYANVILKKGVVKE